ncbi:unnamed protein product [Citrullus colocynthis]|uniref:Uncharacterized protein n=1 Tax=Citrullus colocynthis TaxID=252529 RepID=A0ABP0YTF6_9ROSI
MYIIDYSFVHAFPFILLQIIYFMLLKLHGLDINFIIRKQPHLIHAKKRRRNLCLGLLRVLSISAKPFFSRSHKLSWLFF